MERLHYVDALRVFCMLFGIFVHTTTLGDFGVLEGFSYASRYFRMAAFFVVSAYLAGLFIERFGVSVFLSRRSLALLVPFFSGCMLLNPIAIWLVFRHHGNGDDVGLLGANWQTFTAPDAVQGPGVWHLHLWFLVTLYFYVLAAIPLLRILQGRAAGSWMDSWEPRVPAALHPVLLTAAMVFIAVILHQAVDQIPNLPLLWRLEDNWIFVATLRYFPFFLLGLICFSRPVLWESCHRLSPLLIGGMFISFALKYYGLSDPYLYDSLLDTALNTVITCTFIFALLWVFRTFAAKKNSIGTLFSKSIYTIYFFHYLLIYAVSSFVFPDAGMTWLIFFAISFSTIAIGLLLHLFLVEKIWLLRFLFNGRLPNTNLR
ncbi:MAG: acyltransferase family protein [Magnetospiraceae bacterium]